MNYPLHNGTSQQSAVEVLKRLRVDDLCDVWADEWDIICTELTGDGPMAIVLRTGLFLSSCAHADVSADTYVHSCLRSDMWLHGSADPEYTDRVALACARHASGVWRTGTVTA